MHRIYFLIVLVSTIFNQNIYLFSSTEANSAIRSPKDFLGYEIGDYYTPHYRVVNYFKYLNQAAKNQSKLIEYGKTYEQRSLNILIISSAANMAILEDYREANLALANGKNAAETPVFVWLAYNVHGNETSSSEAAMMTAYHLLAATDQQTKSFLDNAIIVIDPMINPDGRDRFVNWFQHTVGKQANADPNSIEHFEPWPGGRTNHYYFDLNRDWTWASQVETQQRLKIYHQYKPQVYVDFHEMGYNSSYFFFPAAKPFSPYYPESTQKWGKVFGEGNAKMMSRFGRLFYTAQWFDLFYPGYGDSYPSLIGSIGMTYEQGGHSSGGKLVEREDGTQLSLLERASNHYHTSMATIETAVTNKKNLLTDFSRFFKDALNTADKQNFESYIIDSKAANYDLFLNVLSYHDIDLTYVDGRQTVTANGRKQTLTNGQAIVSIKQPNYRLIRTLFDDRVAIPDTAFYDISAWSLPVSFNVPVYKTSDRIKVKTTMAKTPVTFVKSEYAYAFVPIANNTLKFLDQLQRHKIRTRFANKEFTQNGQHFPAGTVLLSNFRNQDISDYHSIVERLAKQFDVQMVALSNGLSDDGID
ncbi:MAG: zinc carboxypeptidase, partial [Calditrichaeota bacterium]|nr:zinc carboxypeptidase [Calditrichota bacterium]